MWKKNIIQGCWLPSQTLLLEKKPCITWHLAFSLYIFSIIECQSSVLYLGSPRGRGKVGGCSPSILPGAEGGVSRALWCEEVSSSGSTVWQAWSFKWKRWPQ